MMSFSLGEMGHFAWDCPNSKSKKKKKGKYHEETSIDEDKEPKHKPNPCFKKKFITKDKIKGKDKRKTSHEANVAGEWIANEDSSGSSSTSDDDLVVGLALTTS